MQDKIRRVTGLNLYTSNQLEKLAGRLSSMPAARTVSPFEQDIIVVQSRGMARWVSLQLAEANGICMNCDFPFPRAFIEETLRKFFPEMADPVVFSAEAMAWRIYALLPALARRRELAQVRNYLGGDEGLKAFQLAEKIARLFDQYLVYRPGMLLRWERDTKEKDWQAVVWRELVGKKPAMHLAAVAEILEERMAKPPAGGALPARVSIFGVTALPPLYLRVFFGLAKHCEVNVFSLEPSTEYHGHDLAPKTLARRAAKKSAPAGEAPGNALLASLGRLNRDFTELRLELDERAGFVTHERAADFAEPGDGAMLSVIQGDILRARDRGGDETPKIAVATGDCSIQIHSCHSPMREIEVLYDQLLDLFNNDPALKSRDIVVMAPDIEKYAPFIHAVFGSPEEEGRRIPFSVADRAPRSESPAVAAFLALLVLPGARCTATEIFALIDSPPLRARYDFTDDDIALIRDWIAESGIRWGIDGAHREQFAVPAMETATWRAGFERLLLGRAMDGGDRAVFEGIVPCDEAGGDDAETLGRFISAAEALFALAAELPGERPLGEWVGIFREVLSRFFEGKTSADAAGLRSLQMALDAFEVTARAAGDGKPVELAAVRHHLESLLGEGEQRGGFFSGGVTFCALKPMRSIPARVLCLIGMGDEAFPRRVNPPAFDLMARQRECGDRSPRDDDRYGFLESLLSARGHFYISYPGRSAADNTELPPSTVVSELLDCMDRSFVFPDRKSAREFVVRRHRLHAFSRRYFDGGSPDFFSFSAANAAASRSLAEAGAPAPVRLALPLPEPDAGLHNVELRGLVEFFSHPAKYFTRRRLDIEFPEDEELLQDHEVFESGGLDVYKVKQEILAVAIEGGAADAGEFATRGLLPPGSTGKAQFQDLRGTATEFLETLTPELREGPGEPMAVDLRIGEFSLAGKIEGVHAGRIVQYRCAELKPKDWLRAWIHHLAACAASPDAGVESVLAGEDGIVTFPPVADAKALLEDLLQIYWEGLRQPPHFFPASSFAYARAEIHPKPKEKTPSITRARNAWNGSDGARKKQGSARKKPPRPDGEKEDAYNRFCFGESDPLGDRFVELAIRILGPMLRSVPPL